MESIIKQKQESCEFICILDGCNKGTEQICYDYEKEDKRIVIYKQENKGEGASRNKGIELAKRKVYNIY